MPALVPDDPPSRGGRSKDELDRAIPLVYRELRAIAHRHLSSRREGETLNSTALVHEAYLKLGGQAGAAWQDRAHFFALASVVMRQILTDRARARLSLKRGGMQRRITLDEQAVASDDQAESLLQLDEALVRLSEVAPRLVRVVECRFFGGMSEDEIGSVLGVTPRTVRRDWDKARLLLRRALSA
jgi:RNA polymerase sigma factor (TIGR02999 family)